MNLTPYNVLVSQTFSRDAKVKVDGNPDDTDLKEAYEKEYYDIKALLHILKQYIKEDLIENRTKMFSTKQLEVIYLSCLKWHEDEYEVISNPS